MKTNDLFKFSRSSKRLNESLEKAFGKKINFENFETPKLEDARNKLRTQISQLRNQSGFNETIENDHLMQVQWMHDAIVAELMHRQEHIVNQDETVDETPYTDKGNHRPGWMLRADPKLAQKFKEKEELQRKREKAYGNPAAGKSASEGFNTDVEMELHQLTKSNDMFDAIYNALGRDDAVGQHLQAMANEIAHDHGLHPDDDVEQIISKMADELESQYGDPDLESMAMEKAPPGAKAERMVKHIKAGYAKDGKLTDKEKSIAYATAWKHHNKEKNESIETGEDMNKLQEGEIQQASAIVTAKTMVDRVGRWIEELSGMENDTLLQLGDSIRDEMGQEQAKNFISAVAPAIQQALENLKTTRETLASGVRTLTGEEQPAEMLGTEVPAGGEEEMGAVEPDAMNTGGEEEMGPPEDEFAAAEPAAGGMETSGREQRESIERQNNLLKILAG